MEPVVAQPSMKITKKRETTTIHISETKQVILWIEHLILLCDIITHTQTHAHACISRETIAEMHAHVCLVTLWIAAVVFRLFLVFFWCNENRIEDTTIKRRIRINYDIWCRENLNVYAVWNRNKIWNQKTWKADLFFYKRMNRNHHVTRVIHIPHEQLNRRKNSSMWPYLYSPFCTQLN